MKFELTNRAKVLAAVVVLIGAGAAAWFLYGEEWLAGPAPAPMATAPKPAAKKAPEAKAPEAPKPAPVAEAPKPAPEPAKPVAVPASAPVTQVAQAPAPAAKEEPAKPKAAAKRDRTQARALAKEASGKPAAVKEPAKAEALTPIPAPIPVQTAAVPPETAVPPAVAAAPAQAPAPAPVRQAAAPAPVTPKVVGSMRFNDLVTAVLYRDSDAVNALLAFGKWPDKGDSRGMTPLMYAAMLGDAPIAESLLKAGANPNATGPGGDTAVSIAREKKNGEMEALLKRHGAR